MHKVITYGVLHYNPLQNAQSRKDLVECLESLSNNRDPSISSEVYVIDQGNPADELDFVVDHSTRLGLKCISLKQNLGIAGGINFIANLGKDSDYIGLVTSDVIFPKLMDVTLIQELKNNPDIMQICPLSDKSELDYQKTEVDIALDPLLCFVQELTIQFWPQQAFQLIKGYYEPFRACYENIDAALRLFMCGKYTAISRRIKCIHKHGGCIKSGARNHTYDGHINMPNGFNQEMVASLFHTRWCGLNNILDLYRPINKSRSNDIQKIMLEVYSNNIQSIK